jgi:hypothetical protein
MLIFNTEYQVRVYYERLYGDRYGGTYIYMVYTIRPYTACI